VLKARDQRGELPQLESQVRGLELSEAKRLRGLESENGKLKKLLADAMLDNAALKDLLTKKWRRPLSSERLSLMYVPRSS